MLETLKQKVQTRTQNSNDRIVVGVFQNMINSHNDFCGCDYCLILREYVDKKVQLTKVNRWLDDDEEYNGTPDYDRWAIVTDRLKNEINNLKIEKDKLKQLT